MARGKAALLLLVATLAAGCSQGDPVPQGIPVDEAGEALPNVEGYVVDGAIRPLHGVRVRILSTDVEAVTDADGHYAIHRPTLAAEDVLLSASLPGFKSLTQQLQLTGYRSARMDFRLEHDPRQVARVDVLEHRGVLGCQASAFGQGVLCEAPAVSLNGVRWPEPTAVWPIALDFYVQGALVEVHWDAETGLAEQLYATLRGPVIGCCEDDNAGLKGEALAAAQGGSPLRLELAQEQARTFPNWSELWLEVRLPDGSASVAFSRAQVFDAFAAVFYVEPAPAGFAFQ